MSAKMMQFVSVPPSMPDKRGVAVRKRGLRRDLWPVLARAGDRAGIALRAVRRAVLPGPLPAAQQHPRLAAADRRGPPRGGLRAVLGDQQHAGDLRPHLPAGPAVRGQLRHRAVRARHGDHRRGREDTSPTPPSSMGWVKPVRPARELGAVGRDHRRRAGRPRRRRASCASRATQVTRLRPLRPRRRPADLRHPRLQAGEGRRRAPRAKHLARRRHRTSISAATSAATAELRRAAPAPRRRLHRHRRLQGARPRGARARAARASCRRSTTSPPATARAWATTVPAFDDGTLNAAGKHVVVIGGGDTAMDCVRTAIRQGAQVGQLPLPPRPRQHAGLAARGRATPRRRASSSSGSRPPRRSSATPGSRRVRAHRMRLGAPDASGRQAPEIEPGSSFRARGRSRDQGAGLRSGGPAGACSASRSSRSAAGARSGSTGAR